MIGIFLRRLASALPILVIVSLLTFGMMHMIPGDPAAAIAGLSATPEQIRQLRHDLGLDEPFIVQLVTWYGGLLHGNLGRSLLMGQPVVEVMLFRLPVTMALAAVCAGADGAVRPDRRHLRGTAAEQLGRSGRRWYLRCSAFPCRISGSAC